MLNISSAADTVVLCLPPFLCRRAQIYLMTPKEKPSHNPPENGFILTSPVRATKTKSHGETWPCSSSSRRIRHCTLSSKLTAVSDMTTRRLKVLSAFLKKVSFCVKFIFWYPKSRQQMMLGCICKGFKTTICSNSWIQRSAEVWGTVVWRF